MARLWEVRGLFGNEFAMESAIREIQKLKPASYKVIDRRNLQVILPENDEETRTLVRNIIEIAHGFVDGEAPPGELEKRREELRLRKIEDFKKKRANEAKRKKEGKH